MVIEILYRDKQDWTSITGVATDWTNYAKKYKSERVRLSYLEGVTTSDIWNGEDTDIQHVKYDGYIFEFNIRESENDFVSTLKACSDVVIVQYSETDTEIITDSWIVDTSKSEYIQIEELEPVADTSASKLKIKFRTNKTIINKADPVLLTNVLSVTLPAEVSPEWRELGQSLEKENIGSISAMGDRLFCAFDLGTNELITYTFNGGIIKQIGNSLITSQSGAVSIATLTATRVVIADTGLEVLQAYDWDGINWSTVGSPFILPFPGVPEAIGLTTTLIAYIDRDYGNLSAYTFNGSTWSLTGSTLSIGVIGDPALANLTTSNVAFIDSTNENLQTYTFNGSTWSSVGSSLNIPGIGNVSITRLSTSIITFIDRTNETLKTFTFNGSVWTDNNLDLVIPGINNPCLTSFTEYEVMLASSGLDVFQAYSYGETYYYFSDFDVINYNRDTENILVPWSDSSQKTAQTIDQSGVQYLQYLTTDNHALFIKRLKASILTTINEVEINEPLTEKLEIAENYIKIIVSGITDVDTNTIDLGKNQTHKLELGATTYYSDFAIQNGETIFESVILDWWDNSKVLAQTTDKPTTLFTLFLANSAFNAFKTAFYTATFFEIDDVVVTEVTYINEPITPSLNKIVVSGVIAPNVTDFNVSPLNTYNITIDGTPFYTDYKPILSSETPDLDTTENETGINTTAKSISKQVTEMRLFLDEADAFSLKSKFEAKSTTKTVNGTPILEERDITPNQLGVDFWEVICPCLTGTIDT